MREQLGRIVVLGLFGTMATAISSPAVGGAVNITHGSTTIAMDFVHVSDAGNKPDDTGYGSVGYEYNIGKYEVTADQWAAVIAADSTVGNAGCFSGLQPTGVASWYEAARFCNWLTSGSAATGVYTINSSSVTINRNYRNAAGTAYFIPTEDEWYKAAYYDGAKKLYYDYPTGKDDVPDGIDFSGDPAFDAVFRDSESSPAPSPNAVTSAGVASPYGTIGQGGNILEWNETGTDSSRGLRGGDWYYSRSSALLASNRDQESPWGEYLNIGFRVGSVQQSVNSVPEPGSIAMLLGMGAMGLVWWWRRK